MRKTKKNATRAGRMSKAPASGSTAASHQKAGTGKVPIAAALLEIEGLSALARAFLLQGNHGEFFGAVYKLHVCTKKLAMANGLCESTEIAIAK